jgi:ABC-type polysaccharide/polyol phosphate export permease
MKRETRDERVMRAVEDGVGWVLGGLMWALGPVLRVLGRFFNWLWARSARTVAAIVALAVVDLLRWLRSPMVIASSFVPPLGMTLFLVVLSFAVTAQPVALVVKGQGSHAERMRQIIASDDDAYILTITDAPTAQHLLDTLQVAAIITIPEDFDAAVKRHDAVVHLTLNNVDIDFSDDIRRSVDRSVARFHEPELTTVRKEGWDADDGPMTFNTYGVLINEQDLRETNVDWMRFQIIPALVLLVLCVGLIGTALFCAEDIESDNARYLFLAPHRTWVLLAGRVLGGTAAALLALFVTVVICLWTRLIAPPAEHWNALMHIFLATSLCAAGLGVILGTVVRGARTVALAATVLSTYLFFLGGGFTTIAFLPAWLRTLSAFVPMRYAIDGMRQALFYPELTGVREGLFVLYGTALGTIIVGAFLARRAWARTE